jgi:hypothetical protein
MSKGVSPRRVLENGEQPWVKRKEMRVGGDIRAAWCSGVQPAARMLAQLERAERQPLQPTIVLVVDVGAL